MIAPKAYGAEAHSSSYIASHPIQGMLAVENLPQDLGIRVR